MTAAAPGATPDPAEAPAGRARRRIWLVAEREIRQRVRAKSFRIMTGISVVAVAVAIVVPHVLNSHKHPIRVVVIGRLQPEVSESVLGVEALTGLKVKTTGVPTSALADDELRHGQADIAISNDSVTVRRTLAESDTSNKAQLAHGLASAIGLQKAIVANGIDPKAAQRALTAPPVPIASLAGGLPARTSQRTTALFGSILLYVFLSLYGTWILTGVVEEKASRVVEVLLATLRPRQLLAGKVLGIGVVALGQGLLIVTTALITSRAIGSNYLNGTNATLLVETFVWFVLGFGFYSTLYGAAGSLVTRQEDAQNATFPITLPLLVAYLVSFSVLGSNQGNPFLTVLSFLPFSAPISMPVRVAVGAAGQLDVAIAMVLMVVGIVVMANVAGKVYAGAILRTGKRARWRDVLREQARRPARTT